MDKRDLQILKKPHRKKATFGKANVTKFDALNILILSDLHFGSLAEHEDFKVEKSPSGLDPLHKVSMDADFKEKIGAISKIDLILAPGDLTSTGCPKEFELAMDFLRRTQSSIKTRPPVFHTYGNHDINWTICDLALADDKNPPNNPGYLKLASHAPQLFAPMSDSVRCGPVPGSGIYKNKQLELIILNSGFFCYKHHRIKNGKLGEEQRAWLKSYLKTSTTTDSPLWRVCMVHHHPYPLSFPAPWPDHSTLEDGSEFLDIIGEFGCDAVIHGHRHHPKVETVQKANWMRPITFHCAGSFGVSHRERAHGQIDNTYHLMQLEHRHPQTQAAVGKIRTFFFSMQGWTESQREHTATPDNQTRGNMPSPKDFGSVATTMEREQAFMEHLTSLVGEIQESGSSKIRTSFMHKVNFEELPIDLRTAQLSDLNRFLGKFATKGSFTVVQDFPNAILQTN